MKPWLKYLLLAITWSVAFICLVVILAYVTHHPFLQLPYPSFFPISFYGAVSLLLCSLGWICLIMEYGTVVLLFVIPMLFLAIIFSLENAFRLDLGASHLIDFEFFLGITSNLRPSAHGSFAGCLIGIAQICLLGRYFRPLWLWIAGLLTSLAFAMTTFSLYGYLVEIGLEISLFESHRMSLYGASLFFLLNFAGTTFCLYHMSKYPKQSKYFASIVTFILAVGIALALYTAPQMRVKNSLLGQVMIEGERLSQVVLSRLQAGYTAMQRFNVHLQGADSFNAAIIEEVSKNYIELIDPLLTVAIIDLATKQERIFFDPFMREKTQVAMKEMVYNRPPLSSEIYAQEFLDESPKLAIQSTVLKDNQEKFLVVFVFDSERFFVTHFGFPARIEVLMDDLLMYTNDHAVIKDIAVASYFSRFQNVELETSVSVNEVFIDRILGPIPDMGFVVGIFCAIIFGAIVYLMQEYQSLTAELTASSKTKTMFLANVSHEIRTPLHGIIGTGSMLETTPLEPKQKRYLTIIMLSARHLLDLVNNILDLTKIESEAGPLVTAPSDFHVLCQNQVDILRNKATEKGLELVLNYQQEQPGLIDIAERQVKQVIFNLVGNGIKFTDKGQVTLDVSVRKTKGHMAEISLNVKDTGVGIPDDKKHLIFQKFRQIDSDQSIQKGGTGLGLFLTKSLVEKMGGTIWFESVLGEGSVFHVILPTTFIEKAAGDAHG